VPQSDLLNSKFQFLYWKIVQQEFTMFKTIWLELCLAAQRQLFIIWQLLLPDPIVGARSLLMRNDIIAAFAGESLMIWRCRPVVPEKIFLLYQIDNTCYAYLPIQVNNRDRRSSGLRLLGRRICLFHERDMKIKESV